MKGPDEGEDFVYLLDEHWQCVIDTHGFGLDLTGSTFLLNSGAEFVALESRSPLLGFHGFARAAKLQGKFVDVERGFRIQDQGDSSLFQSQAISIKLDKAPVTDEVSIKGKTDSSATSLPLCEPMPPNGCSLVSSKALRNYTARSHAAASPPKGCSSCHLPIKGKESVFRSPLKRKGVDKTCNLLASRSSTGKEGLMGASFVGRTSSVDVLLFALLLDKVKQTFESVSSSRTCSTPQRGRRSQQYKYHIHQEYQLDSAQTRSDDHKGRGKSSNGNVPNVRKQGGSELLGEALCRAQTRARRAEKLAAQALIDKEKIVQLLFREAQTICTYKQRAQALQLENMLLRRALKIDLEVSNSIPHKIVEKHSGNLLEKGSSPVNPHQVHHFSRQNKERKQGQVWGQRSSSFSCTVGLAFVLGVSIAGAGLMFGWCMGWVLFAM